MPPSTPNMASTKVNAVMQLRCCAGRGAIDGLLPTIEIHRERPRRPTRNDRVRPVRYELSK
jgi:hypothetical protein